MKPKPLVLALLITLAVSFAYMLGYHNGTSSLRATLNAPTKLRVLVGGGLRHGRNDVSQFTATGSVTASETPVQER